VGCIWEKALLIGGTHRLYHQGRRVNQTRNQQRQATSLRLPPAACSFLDYYLARKLETMERRVFSELHGVTTQETVLFTIDVFHISHFVTWKHVNDVIFHGRAVLSLSGWLTISSFLTWCMALRIGSFTNGVPCFSVPRRVSSYYGRASVFSLINCSCNITELSHDIDMPPHGVHKNLCNIVIRRLFQCKLCRIGSLTMFLWIKRPFCTSGVIPLIGSEMPTLASVSFY
jgi:hypothetical protein